MADKFTKEERSQIMSRVLSTNTKPEILVRRFLFANGFRYKKNDKRLPGKPDIVLPKYKTVIFVHGCFWHGHEGCRKSILPTTNVAYWENKIGRNISRGIENENKLLSMNWKVITIWECELKNKTELSLRLSKLIDQIKN